MKYTYTTVYWITGVTFGSDQSDMKVAEDSNRGLKAVITSNLDAYCLDMDRSIVVGNLLLNRLFGSRDASNVSERLISEIAKIQEERTRKYSVGAYLVVVVQGEVDSFVTNHQQEYDDFIVCLECMAKESIRSAVADQITTAVTSVAISIENVLGIKKVMEAVIFFRDDGKPIYAYNFSISATPSLSKPLRPETIKPIQTVFDKLLTDKELARISYLLASSLQSSDDSLRSFLSTWTALEIFVNKTFSQYEAMFFQQLVTSKHPEMFKQYLNRFRSVMNDKYRLADKFMVISYQLCPDDADKDLQNFMIAKKERDKLSHGQNISEAGLPIDMTQKLIHKYLLLHLGVNRT